MVAWGNAPQSTLLFRTQASNKSIVEDSLDSRWFLDVLHCSTKENPETYYLFIVFLRLGTIRTISEELAAFVVLRDHVPRSRAHESRHRILTAVWSRWQQWIAGCHWLVLWKTPRSRPGSFLLQYLKAGETLQDVTTNISAAADSRMLKSDQTSSVEHTETIASAISAAFWTNEWFSFPYDLPAAASLDNLHGHQFLLPSRRVELMKCPCCLWLAASSANNVWSSESYLAAGFWTQAIQRKLEGDSHHQTTVYRTQDMINKMK